MRSAAYDVIVVGGGFFGCALALEARRYKKNVLLLEAEPELMLRSSYVNQARIHQGYHYPRSLLTAERSRVNFSLFTQAYPDCVVDEFDKLYAIARDHSKVSAAQFRGFCERIGAPLAEAPSHLRRLFSPHTVEDVFAVKEYAFDALKLRAMVERQLASAEVEIALGREVTQLRAGERVQVTVVGQGQSEPLAADWLFNCTYSSLNHLLASGAIERVPLKHEFVEITLVEPPPELSTVGITLMDGPFFSCMPFPAAHAHSFTHVRYTPHETWHDDERTPPRRIRLEELKARAEPSLFQHMLRDASRFVPVLSELRYLRSLWEVKTLLPQSERDDSRPILFRRAPTAARVVSVLGAKIDNVLDMREHVRNLLS